MEAAQFFHFDMDRPKWLKFFIYLTDVGTENGPHTFVSGSQRTGGIPRELLRKGYSRMSDEEVLAFYPPQDVVEFAAPRGTIIAEDTRGLHKGKHVHSGDRLVLQLQFSNSMFGGSYERARFGEPRIEPLRRQIEQYPSVYSAYL
jgi:ectoine hydroxylase-related dioxygenase (phytanoyl-CoA dioxygenase family)